MAGRTHRVAHVVEAVEHGHEVVRPATVRRGRSRLEPDPVSHTGRPSPLLRRLDRPGVVVGTDERGLGEGLGHDDRRGTVPTSHVRDVPACFELGHHAVECRQPLGHQMGVVAGPEEAFTAFVHVVHVLVPPEAIAAPRLLDDLRGVDHRPRAIWKKPGR